MKRLLGVVILLIVLLGAVITILALWGICPISWAIVWRAGVTIFVIGVTSMLAYLVTQLFIKK